MARRGQRLTAQRDTGKVGGEERMDRWERKENVSAKSKGHPAGGDSRGTIPPRENFPAGRSAPRAPGSNEKPTRKTDMPVAFRVTHWARFFLPGRDSDISFMRCLLLATARTGRKKKRKSPRK